MLNENLHQLHGKINSVTVDETWYKTIKKWSLLETWVYLQDD